MVLKEQSLEKTELGTLLLRYAHSFIQQICLEHSSIQKIFMESMLCAMIFSKLHLLQLMNLH